MIKYLILLKDLFLNIFFSHNYGLYYVVENANWVTDNEWKNISKNLNQKKIIKSRITSTHVGLRNKIVHFGSVNTFISIKGPKKVHKSNKIILTWFHVVSGDIRLNFIPSLNNVISYFHTSCEITKNKLIDNGVDSNKIVVIPLGVDLKTFIPGKADDIRMLRQALCISKESTIIGSFQKDGDGWGKGNSPKFVKGPDIFCDVMEKLALNYPIHILLTGPARGYVINRLKKAGIKYTHVYPSNAIGVIPYYQILDLYLVSSREEGGPKALLESLACGVPLVSTVVGMAPEIIIDGQNGFLVGNEDFNGLYDKTKELVCDASKRKFFSTNGLNSIRSFDYNLISKRYWDFIYSKI